MSQLPRRRRTPWIGILTVLAAFGATCVFTAARQTRPAAPRAPFDLRDLAWMSGSWTSESDGSFMEEHWTEPRGDNMTGMFRVLVGGKATFYELLSIDRDGAGVWLRIKHFDKGLVGREDREKSTVLKLVGLEKEEAAFDNGDPENRVRLVYRRDGPDALAARLEKRQGGKTTTEDFRMTRRSGPGAK